MLAEINKPLTMFGHDRLLLDDISAYGLRRRVIARRADWPDVQAFLDVAKKEARGAEIYCWAYERNGFYFSWICWKVEAR